MRYAFTSLIVGLLTILPAFGKSQPEALRRFVRGDAGPLSYQQMVNAGAFVSYPMRGGTYERSEPVKYIVLHSTETASPADARRVIRSWSNRGERHPGAQFVVDRDGTIYSTVNPDQATIHVNTNRTVGDYNNDNTIGIEIVRAGKQKYTASQMQSVARLVAYLQDHYGLRNSAITTHGAIQPSDRSDPVKFDMKLFNTKLAALKVKPTETIAVRKIPQLNRKLPAAEQTIATQAPRPAPELTRAESTAPPLAPAFRID